MLNAGINDGEEVFNYYLNFKKMYNAQLSMINDQ